MVSFLYYDYWKPLGFINLQKYILLFGIVFSSLNYSWHTLKPGVAITGYHQRQHGSSETSSLIQLSEIDGQILYAILTYPRWPDKIIYVSVSLKIRELFLLQEGWLFSLDSKFKRYTNLLPAMSSLVCGSHEFKSWLQNPCRQNWFITVFRWEVLAKFFSQT